MSKKKNKKKNPRSSQSRRPPQSQRQPQLQSHDSEVRLSQCMIVKDEEKHIERALGWAKEFAFEQIVVDTGSTDRTVELAEKLGAKVYHFEWINDFSAAKNFAMDRCKGNWIAILDADEYMPNEDVVELMALLKKIQSDPAAAKKYEAISTSLVDLDDDNNVKALLTTMRIFRNSPKLRYAGKIHETVKVNDYISVPKLRVMHTGYAQSTFEEKDKRMRNIKLLRDELASNPDNTDIMIYLADSIKSSSMKEDYEEAEELYLKALSSKNPATVTIKRLAYDFLLRRMKGVPARTEEAINLCNTAIKELPNNIDYYYYRGMLYNEIGNYIAASDDLAKCEEMLMSSTKALDTRILLPSPIPLFIQRKITAKGLNDEAGIVRNSTIINEMLKDSRADKVIIGVFIMSSIDSGSSDDEVLSGLDGIYDLNNPNDLLFLARAAKDCAAIGFARKIMEMASGLIESQ